MCACKRNLLPFDPCLSNSQRWLQPRSIRQRHARRWAVAPAAAALGPATAAVKGGTAAALSLASLVPTFPRVGGQAVRDWIGQRVENMPGFNGDDLAHLLFPDLVGLVDGPTVLISSLLLVAFGYWEGGILLRQLQERRRQQFEQRWRKRDGMSSDDDEAAASRLPPPPSLPAIERARYERRRGLGWLALLTAGLVWCCGVLQGPTPLQP